MFVIRPLVRHACDTLTELNRLHACGRIDRARLHREQLSVLHATLTGLTERGADRPTLAATAPPRVADHSEQVAAEDVRRLADTDAIDLGSVKGHAA